VENRDARLAPELSRYVEGLLSGLDEVPGDRRQKLQALVSYVGHRVGANQPAKLTFICTHNSRRSHLAQIWAQTAAFCFGVPGVETFSGGTEATAFNPRAVGAVERAGFLVEAGADDNLVYKVRWAQDGPVMECFSKVYDQGPNPKKGFAALMTCSTADAACPVVHGAEARISLPFDDPKAFDGADQETARYDERCRQIAREMLWVFSKVELS